MDEATVDLMDGRLLDDPIGEYARLREQAPLHRASIPGVETPVWLATRYEDVKAVLSDPRFVKDANNVPGMDAPNVLDQLMLAYGVPPDYRPYLDTMLTKDGAEHARLRKLVSRAFTVRRVSELRPQVERIVEHLLDELGAAGANSAVELLKDFAFPVSGTVICELLGIDEEDRPRWRAWIDEISAGDPPRFGDADRAMVAHTIELIERRRAQPAEDLLTGLIHAHDEDSGRLTDTEMIAMVLLLIQAGHYTTAHLIANATVLLLDHPDQLARLRGEPELWPRAVHELLRVGAPVPMGGLVHATEDLEVAGAPVRRGEAVVCALVAANHDPSQFDGPERFDITREPTARRETHVSFGHGMHYCLGAALARLEGEVALRRLFARYPDLCLGADRKDLEYQSGPGAMGLIRLPVLLRPR